MVLAAQAVASSMVSCSSNVCGEPGMVVTDATQRILDVLASDVACSGVTPSCQSSDDAGVCTEYLVLPVATGNCHIDVDLANGTRFSADVAVVGGRGCPGFYPAASSDAHIEAP